MSIPTELGPVNLRQFFIGSIIIHPLEHERVDLPLDKVADTAFHTQEDDILHTKT